MSTAQLAELAARLVAINSGNPSTARAGAGEAEIAAWCVRWLREHGVAAELVASCRGPQRTGVVATVHGDVAGPTLALAGHLDTYDWWQPPAAEPSADRLEGPGACDMKGGVALILAALAAFSATNRPGTLVALLTPDEEHGGRGMGPLAAAAARADAAVVLESTRLRVVAQHRGFVRGWIEPQSAAALVRLLSVAPRLGRIERVVRRPRGALVYLRRDVEPGDDAERARHDVAVELRRLGPMRATWDVRQSLATDEREPVVRALRRHAPTEDAGEATFRGWTEAAAIAARGTPALVFGPGGGGAHTRREWLDVAQLGDAATILDRTIATFLRRAGV